MVRVYPNPALKAGALLAGALLLAACDPAGARDKPDARPEPAPAAQAAGAREDVAVFAGGCFWGIEAVFEHVRGVSQAVSGYAGGSRLSAHYQLVGTGRTGHAEAVRVTYDPARVSYGQLLKVYFSVAHDPTQLNRQGPDTGTQYRSEIFTTSAAQQRAATAYIAQLESARTFDRPIVTRVSPLAGFYEAEAHHQDYLRRHPDEPYIVYNDAPKLVALKARFPGLYR
jgi:peptide-methionine (S)-S-oxide reductase